MEFDKKNTIIVSTLLFVLVLVFFNLEQFTGNAGKVLVNKNTLTSSMTTAEVIPLTIKAGEYINVYITPGSGCADKKILIYKEGATHYVTSFERSTYPFGGYRFCKPTVASYKSWNNWDGKYYVWVKDTASGKYVKAPFFVE